MALTYTAIAATTVGSGGASSITFSSIPATYTDLLIKMCARNGTNAPYGYLQFNGDTGSNYSQRMFLGDGSVVSTSSNTNITVINLYGANDNTYTASTFGNSDIYIPNYTSGNFKSLSIDSVGENNATIAASQVWLAGIWSSTSAITSISLQPYSGNFAQYSTATLYGIKNTV